MTTVPKTHRSVRCAGVAILFAVSGLLACTSNAPVSRTQCEVGDWETIGHRDGAQGRRSTALLELQEACIEYGYRAEREPYMRGWSVGAREYCAPSNGFTVGERGGRHENICPDDLRADFAAAYQRGRTIHLARTSVEELEERIEAGTVRLEEVRADLISTAAAQLNPLLTPTRRGELVAELQGLNDEKNRLVEELPQWREDLERQRRALEQLVLDEGTR